MTYLSRNSPDFYAQFRSRASTPATYNVRYLISVAQHLDFHDLHDQPITLLCPDSRFPKNHHQPNLAAGPPRRHYGEVILTIGPPFHRCTRRGWNITTEPRNVVALWQAEVLDPEEVVGISRTETRFVA
jgi:hypothetical protein